MICNWNHADIALELQAIWREQIYLHLPGQQTKMSRSFVPRFVPSHLIPEHQANCGLYSYVLLRWTFKYLNIYRVIHATPGNPACSPHTAASPALLYRPTLTHNPSRALSLWTLCSPKPLLLSLQRTQIGFYMVLVWTFDSCGNEMGPEDSCWRFQRLPGVGEVPGSPCAWLPPRLLFCISGELPSDAFFFFRVLGSVSVSCSLRVGNGGGRLSGPQRLGLWPTCLRTCAQVTGHTTSDWIRIISTGKVMDVPLRNKHGSLRETRKNLKISPHHKLLEDLGKYIKIRNIDCFDQIAH